MDINSQRMKISYTAIAAVVVIIVIIAGAVVVYKSRGTSPATYGASVSISPSSQGGGNGATLSYTVTVHNTGNVSDIYSLTISDNASPSLDPTPNWNSSVSPTSLTVSAGGSGTATLSVNMPSVASSGMSDNVTVTASGTGVSASSSCTAEVSGPATYGVSVSISPSSENGDNGAALVFIVTVNNTGNIGDNYALSLSDNALPSWGPSISPASISVLQGENGTATINVTIPSDAAEGTLDNIIVTAEGTGVSASDSCIARVSAPISHEASVSIVDFDFQPSSITVSVGTTVTWTNTGSTTHTVTSDSGVFDSGDISPGDNFQFTFENVGAYPYHCSIHTFMTGTVKVQ
jgi:plastocyanin